MYTGFGWNTVVVWFRCTEPLYIVVNYTLCGSPCQTLFTLPAQNFEMITAKRYLHDTKHNKWFKVSWFVPRYCLQW